MQAATFKRWEWIHKWSSLVCTLFLIMLCITGLPLIFHDEIDATLNPTQWQPAHTDGRRLTYDEVLREALAQQPGDVPIFMSFDTDRPVVNVTTGPNPNAADNQMTFMSFDHTSGARVPPADVGESVMEFILQLHTDMFLGLPGMLFLGAMGIMFVLAVISGVVVYRQFMRNLPFGTVRHHKRRRTRFLDYHNLFGITTVAWVFVVSLTGTINTLETPIIDAWRNDSLSALINDNAGGKAVSSAASLDAAIQSAKAELPGMTLQFIAFPGSAFSTSRHFAVFLHGTTPLTSEIIQPVLVDAVSGEVAGAAHTPWYVTLLSVSRPLHFGDYGGLGLKLVWAALTVMTLVVLITGLYLWWKKRKLAAAKTVSKPV